MLYLEDLLGPVVVDRRNGRTGEHPDTDAVLHAALEAMEPSETCQQPINWYGRQWAAKSKWHRETRKRLEALADTLDPAGQAEKLVIRRSDVFARRDDPVDLFLAAMAWGFGTTGYGWWRTAEMVNTAGRNAEKKVRDAVAAYHTAWTEGGAETLALAWTYGEGKIAGLGPAFASKVAYFALYDLDSGKGPLIADLNTAWSLWALDGTWDSRYDADKYAHYVEWCEGWGRKRRCRSDDVERALFSIGPTVRRLWRRTRLRSVESK